MASSSKPTKAAASAARERALALKAQERRVQRRNYALAVAGILVVIVTVVLLFKFISSSAEVPNSGTLTNLSAADASGGILINQDGSLGGTPPDGAVRLDVYLDLMCPICNSFEEINSADLRTLREAGTIAVYYHPVAILDYYSRGSQYSTRAASALATVTEYDPEHFEAYFNALFANQPAENTTGLTNAELEEIAKGIGVPEDVVAKFKDGEFTEWVIAATDTSSVDGLQGTPWIRIEQELAITRDAWSQQGYLAAVLQYIRDNGMQAYLDEVAAAQAEPTATATP
jgi:protein-disulfide isomerase